MSTPGKTVIPRVPPLFGGERPEVLRSAASGARLGWLYGPPAIIDTLEMPTVAIRVFRLACLGAMFHVLFLITTLVLLYFELLDGRVRGSATLH